MSVKYHKITQFPDGFHTRPENQANDFEKVTLIGSKEASQLHGYFTNTIEDSTS